MEIISYLDTPAQFYLQPPGSLFIASYDSQGYGGGRRTRLHAGLHSIAPILFFITTRREPRRKYRSFSYTNRFRGNMSALPSNGRCHVVCLHGKLFAEPLPRNECYLRAVR
jgi:hypothetical protein